MMYEPSQRSNVLMHHRMHRQGSCISKLWRILSGHMKELVYKFFFFLSYDYALNKARNDLYT